MLILQLLDFEEKRGWPEERARAMAIYVTSSSALLLMTLMRQLPNSQYEDCPEKVQRVGMKGNLWATPELCLLYLKTCSEE